MSQLKAPYGLLSVPLDTTVLPGWLSAWSFLVLLAPCRTSSGPPVPVPACPALPVRKSIRVCFLHHPNQVSVFQIFMMINSFIPVSCRTVLLSVWCVPAHWTVWSRILLSCWIKQPQLNWVSGVVLLLSCAYNLLMLVSCYLIISGAGP